MQTDTEQTPDQTGEPEVEKLGTRAEVENIGACKRRIKAVVPAEKVEEELERSFKELAGVVRLPGFRPGRVPRRLLEARFGQDLESDLEEALKAASFSEVLEEKALRVIGKPTFDKVRFERGKDFEYEVEVEVRPEFELPPYKGLEVERREQPVTDADVEEHLEAMRRRLAKQALIEPTEANDHDMFLGRYALARDGQTIKDDVEAFFVPASGVLHRFRVDDLAAKVRAWDRSGEAPLELRAIVPQEYADEGLRGAEVDLTFRLGKVVRLELPAATDEFARAAGAESIDDLKSQLRTDLLRERRREADREVEEKLVDRLLEVTEMDTPESLIEGQRKRVQHEREQELLERGMTPEDVKAKLVAEGDRVLDELRRDLKRTLILSEIADQEKIFITERQVKERIEQLADRYGVPIADLKADFESSGRLDELRMTLRLEKTRVYLRRNATVKNIGESPDESAGDSSRGTVEPEDRGEQSASEGTQ